MSRAITIGTVVMALVIAVTCVKDRVRPPVMRAKTSRDQQKFTEVVAVQFEAQADH